MPDGRELIQVVRTFLLVCVAWVFFRAESLGQAFEVLGNVTNLDGAPPEGGQAIQVVMWAAAVLAIDVARRRIRQPMALVRRRPGVVGGLVGLALVGVAVFSGGEPIDFIYFQF